MNKFSLATKSNSLRREETSKRVRGEVITSGVGEKNFLISFFFFLAVETLNLNYAKRG
jgi:hypothetical protein